MVVEKASQQKLADNKRASQFFNLRENFDTRARVNSEKERATTSPRAEMEKTPRKEDFSLLQKLKA